MRHNIIVGDCREVLPTLAAESIDACVTDPPYALTANKRGGSGAASLNENSPAGRARIGTGFMGKAWDASIPSPELWIEVLRVMKPGAHLAAFGGTRTFHRLTCAIEDAGFEIRDCLGWLYGSGFPKSKNIGDGWGTALKPAWEPIILARKPLVGTVAGNVQEFGTGALNIDGCRVPGAAPQVTQGGNRSMAFGMAERQSEPHDLGRWPANIAHDGSEEVLAVFPDTPGQLADASSSSSSRKTQNVYGDMKRGNGRDGEPSADSENAGSVGFKMRPGARRGDEGSAARFFYCAKASREDRNEGTHGMPTKVAGMVSNTAGQHMTRRDGGAPGPRENHHPTVKPTNLMRWLCRLVTPEGGTILDPFMGSGSTGKAAEIEGFHFVGIELDHEYAAIAKARIVGSNSLFAEFNS